MVRRGEQPLSWPVIVLEKSDKHAATGVQYIGTPDVDFRMTIDSLYNDNLRHCELQPDEVSEKRAHRTPPSSDDETDNLSSRRRTSGVILLALRDLE